MSNATEAVEQQKARNPDDETYTLRIQLEQAQTTFDQKSSELDALLQEQQRITRHHMLMIKQEQLMIKQESETEARAFREAAADEWVAFGRTSKLHAERRAERKLLSRAIAWHQAFPVMDMDHSVLTARYALATARESAETVRKELHVAQVTRAMSEAAAMAGGSISVQNFGPVVEQLDEYCRGAAHEKQAAKRTVEAHSREMAETRRKLHITLLGDSNK